MSRVWWLGLTVLALPVLADDWSTGGREAFRSGCLSSAVDALGEVHAQRYCTCTLARIEAQLSAAERNALAGTHLPDTLLERLQQISAACLGPPST